jgi:hypothetical protein
MTRRSRPRGVSGTRSIADFGARHGSGICLAMLWRNSNPPEHDRAGASQSRDRAPFTTIFSDTWVGRQALQPRQRKRWRVQRKVKSVLVLGDQVEALSIEQVPCGASECTFQNELSHRTQQGGRGRVQGMRRRKVRSGFFRSTIS